jgi:hypothetical protein
VGPLVSLTLSLSSPPCRAILFKSSAVAHGCHAGLTPHVGGRAVRIRAPATVMLLSPLLRVQRCLPVLAPSLPYFFPPALSGAPPPCLYCCSPPPTELKQALVAVSAMAMPSPCSEPRRVNLQHCQCASSPSSGRAIIPHAEPWFFSITIFIGSKHPHRGCPLSGPPVSQLDARRPWSRAREALEQEAPRGAISPGHTTSPKCYLRCSSRSAKIPPPRRHSNTPR